MLRRCWEFAVLVSLCLLFMGEVFGAEMVFNGRDMSIKISDVPCGSAALAAGITKKLGGQSTSAVGSARITLHGRDKELAGCWVQMDDGNVFLLDEEGKSGALPTPGFKIVPMT